MLLEDFVRVALARVPELDGVPLVGFRVRDELVGSPCHVRTAGSHDRRGKLRTLCTFPRRNGSEFESTGTNLGVTVSHSLFESGSNLIGSYSLVIHKCPNLERFESTMFVRMFSI